MYTLWVIYHSPRWMELVEQGYFTMYTEFRHNGILGRGEYARMEKKP